MRLRDSLEAVAELSPEEFDDLRRDINPEWVLQSLQGTGTATPRKRRLPAEQVIWLVIGMALFRNRSIHEVVSKLDLALPGSSLTVAPSTVVEARARLGAAPLEWLFSISAEDWAHQSARTHSWRGLADGPRHRDPLEHRDGVPGAREQDRRRGPSGAGADHADAKRLHAIMVIARLRRPRRSGATSPRTKSLGGMKRRFLVALMLTTAGWTDREPGCPWEQWGRSDAHDGQTCAVGQPASRVLAEATFDPFVVQEMAETFGLTVHYQVPLNDGDGNVFMMAKTGTYLSCDPPGSGEPAPCGPDHLDSQIWTEKAFRWHAGRLVEHWTFTSDWKPFKVSVWEAMFQPALSGPFIYIPGAGGSVWQVLRAFGIPVRRINPFGRLDGNSFVTGGITTDRDGFLYWNVVRLDPVTGSEQSFLVKATSSGTTRTVSYDALVPDAPKPDDLCYETFRQAAPQPARPWPPAEQLPPRSACGAQRPGVNVTPAIAADGTIFTASHAAHNANYSYVIAIGPDLAPRWARSLRDRVHDGCGVLYPYGTDPFSDCRVGAAFGVDPLTNLAPALRVDDTSSSSPVALPDGGVVYGAYDDYWGQGKLVKLDARGSFLGLYTFGWDSTPAVYRHDGTYSLVIKDNLYNSLGPYYITQLDKDLAVEWQFQNTSTQACARNPDGTVSCVDATDVNPDGFEWCINAPAVDAAGNVYATSEDGNFYAIAQGGILRSKVFLDIAQGAAYTPLSLDPEGRIYALQNGQLSVLGR